MTDAINFEDLRWVSDDLIGDPPRPLKRKAKNGLYHPRQGEKFLMGPIPLVWLHKALCLGGKAIHVACSIWFYAQMTKSHVVGLNLSRLQRFGVQRDAARRGLLQLERAQLVRVERHAGRKPIVTLILDDRALDRVPQQQQPCAEGASYERT